MRLWLLLDFASSSIGATKPRFLRCSSELPLFVPQGLSVFKSTHFSAFQPATRPKPASKGAT